MAISTATTPGQILTSAYVNNNINSGLVYIKEQTIGAGVSTVVVPSAFSTTYDNYRITISKVAVSGTGNSMFLSLSGTAGSTYFANGFYMSPGSTTINGFQSNGVSTGMWLGITGTTMSISLDISSPFLAAATNLVGMTSCSGASFNNTYMGNDTNAASSTGFTLNQATTLLTGGTITVYGYRKA
jgi:hypothetical protein